ncbi:MAG: T9SS type A sorting domain-containing protein [Bacteroidales bacterium]|nr:T9SS type A sorting domain-containing protein [Bacteroidales bacterium]
MKIKSLLIGALTVSTGLFAQDMTSILNKATVVNTFDNAAKPYENTAPNAVNDAKVIMVAKRNLTTEVDEKSKYKDDFNFTADNAGAITINQHNWLQIAHGIEANGGGDYVNDYTVVLDIRVNDETATISLVEANPYSTNGGRSSELNIEELSLFSEDRPFSTIGTAKPEANITKGKWHRIAYVSKGGDGVSAGYIKAYIDGVMVLEATEADYIAAGKSDLLDDRPALNPWDMKNDEDVAQGLFKVCGNNEVAEENGGIARDNAKDINMVSVFSASLTDAEIAILGNADNEFSLGTVSYSALNTLKISPNPTSDFLTIDVKEEAELQIINTVGQVVLATSINGKTEIDVRNIKKGLYFVQIKNEEGKVSSAKVILN